MPISPHVSFTFTRASATHFSLASIIKASGSHGPFSVGRKLQILCGNSSTSRRIAVQVGHAKYVTLIDYLLHTLRAARSVLSYELCTGRST